MRSAADAFGQIVRRLREAGRLLIVAHARPDGDALGSMAALALAARAAGRQAATLVPGDVPARYEFLFAEPYLGARPAGSGQFAALADAADVVVIVDTCAFAQLDGLEAHLRARREKIVVIDHHATTDDVADASWVDTSAAAAGVMVGELIEALGWPLSLPAAEALLAAITTDTGWFRFANTDGRCLRAAARLLEAGVRADELYLRLFQSDRPERLQLLLRTLESLELHCGGRIATMAVRKGDFQRTGARPDETENLVNEALRLECVQTAILLVENTDCVRVSLRSRGQVDVAEVARGFGGGGHPRAAGLRLDEDLDILKARLVAAFRAAMNCGPGE